MKRKNQTKTDGEKIAQRFEQIFEGFKQLPGDKQKQFLRIFPKMKLMLKASEVKDLIEEIEKVFIAEQQSLPI